MEWFGDGVEWDRREFSFSGGDFWGYLYLPW